MVRPYIRDKSTAIILGIMCFAAGSALLYDAWEGRGHKTPIWARWATWW